MAKYAFFSTAAHGHVLPTLPLVTELISRGEQVIYYMNEEHRSSIEAAGARFRDLPPFTPSKAGEDVLSDMIGSLRAEQTDFVVYDFFFPWGNLLAKALQIPAINVRGTYANNEYFSMRNVHQHKNHIWSGQNKEFSAAYINAYNMYSQFVRVGARLNLPVPVFKDPFDIFSQSEALNICMIPRVFQPFAETFDERYVFVGSSILSRPNLGDFPFEALDGRPLLYIALGTLFNERADIFKACIKAFGRTDWQVVLSRGRQSTSFALGPIPANFLVVNYAPQLEILSRASIFISHGGMNSTVESIMAGVPTIFIPQIAEQAINAGNAERFGLGIALNPEAVTAGQLQDAVERIINNRTCYKEKIQAMQSIIRNEGGYKRAVDAIVSLKHKKRLAAPI